MGRFGWLLLCCALAAAGTARADGCDGVTAGDVAARVPFLAGRMRPVAAASGLAFEHVDDARLRLSLDLAAADPVPDGVRRSEYLAERRRELQGSVDAPGAGVTTTVGYEDPVSWTIQVRTPAGTDVVSRGLVTVKLWPACSLLIRWDVLETPSLVGRIRDMNGAIDALRGGVGLARPSAFVPEIYAPVGWPSFAVGSIVTLLSALGCGYVFRGMARGDGPIGAVRCGAGAGAAVAALGLLLQAQPLLANVPALRYADVAAALAASGATLAVAALTGAARVSLPALVLALSSGVYLAVVAYLDWAPSRPVTMAAAMGLTVAGGIGLWAWAAFPAQVRRARERAPGRTRSTRAAGMRAA